jgi:shikimate kinase
MEFLRRSSIVLFLDASFASIKNRVHNESTRGIIGLKNRELKDLYLERRPLYQKYSEITIALPDSLEKDLILPMVL